ncbi:MAG: Paraquat-inducible protein [Labilithrix sp.]|nr:Paraquat-inducible protein [Labilithrix sp.]
MVAKTHYAKLGIFVVLGAIAVVGIVLVFGAISFEKTAKYHTFFDESVQGLELGAPVKLRGVTIGHVSQIAVAQDHEHIDVVSEVGMAGDRQLRSPVAPKLRAQLSTQGITGVKFLSVDVFDPATHPPPPLPFPPPENYIPATPSTLKNLEDIAATTLARLPDVMNAVMQITARVDRLLATLERDDVGSEAVITLRHANDVLRAMQTTFVRLDRVDLGEKAAGTLDELHGAATKLNGVLDQLDGDTGLLASATRATEAFGAIGRSGQRTQRDLDGALRDVSDAADAIRSLARAIERDPDMLLKGKSGPKTR